MFLLLHSRYYTHSLHSLQYYARTPSSYLLSVHIIRSYALSCLISFSRYVCSLFALFNNMLTFLLARLRTPPLAPPSCTSTIVCASDMSPVIVRLRLPSSVIPAPYVRLRHVSLPFSSSQARLLLAYSPHLFTYYSVPTPPWLILVGG